MVVKVEENFEKTGQYCEDKEMKDIITKFYLIKRILIISLDLILILLGKNNFQV